MDLLNQVVSYLNANQPVVIGIGGLVAVFVQYGVNHIKGMGKLTNYILGLIALPGVATIGLAYATSLNVGAYPWVAIVGQIIYAAYEKIKANAVLKATAEPAVLGPGV